MMGIPRRIVQTHKSLSVLPEQRQTWIDHHPDYDYCFYNDLACEQFFQEHYPDFLACWHMLPLKAQKADLFRYLNVYHYGGVYADVDTLCRAPVGSYLAMGQDQLAVGLEMSPAQYTRGPARYTHEYGSPWQLLQWTFAASVKVPALLQLAKLIRMQVSQLNHSALQTMSRFTRYTLELTGPIAFTNAINYYAAQDGSPPVVIQPYLTWGYNPWHDTATDPLTCPAVKVIHTYDGSWKEKHLPVAAIRGANLTASDTQAS